MDKVGQLRIKPEKDISSRCDCYDFLKGIAIIVVSLNHVLDVIWGKVSIFQLWGYAWELFAFFSWVDCY